MIVVLLIFTSVSYLFNQLGRIQLENTIAFTLLDVSLVLILLSYTVQQIRKRTLFSFPHTSLFYLSTGFIGVALFSLILNPLSLPIGELLTSSLYLLRLLLYGSMFYVVYSLLPKQKGFVMVSQLVVGTLLVVLGFVQYIYYPFLRNLYYLGWDEHLYRLFSTFLDPNFAGAFFVLYFLLLLGYFFKVLEKKISGASIGYGILLILTLLAIYLTYSRTAFLMLLIGSAVFFLIRKEFKILLLGFITFITLFIVFANANFEGLNPLRLASSVARIESAQNALAIIKEYPVFGVGFNTYRYAQLEKGFREETTIPDHAASSTDNIYLFVLATTGVIGFSLFVVFIGNVTKRLYAGLAKKDMMHEVILSSLIAVLFGSLFNNLLFYPALLLWMVILAGLIPRE